MGGLGGFGCKNESQRLSYIYVLSGGGGPPKPPSPPPSAYLLYDNLYRFRKLPRRNWVGGGIIAKRIYDTCL